MKIKFEDILISSFLLFLAMGLSNFGGINMGLANTSTPTPKTSRTPTPTGPTSTPGVSPTPSVTPVPGIPTNTPTIRPSNTPTPILIISNTPTPSNVPTSNPTSIPCPITSANSYSSITVDSTSDIRPAENHPDKNLQIRGYLLQNSGNKTLIDYPGSTDDKAPQLSKVLNKGAQFTNLYSVYDWNWTTDTKGGLLTNYAVTLLGLASSPGVDEVHAPEAGQDIDSSGHQTIVLYANENSITLQYTKEDTVANGYTIHIDGFCTDSNLLQLYNNQNSSGRSSLPALKKNQVIGKANGSEVKVAIRDRGMFMDPRSRKDWWH